MEALKYVLIKPTESYLPAIKSRDHASKTQSLSDFRREPISPYDFEFLHVLGRGGYGRVFLCRDTHTKEVCAMKIIDKRGLIKYGHTHRAYVENKVFMNVDHPFLMVGFYIFFRPKRRYSFFFSPYEIHYKRKLV